MIVLGDAMFAESPTRQSWQLIPRGFGATNLPEEINGMAVLVGMKNKP